MTAIPYISRRPRTCYTAPKPHKRRSQITTVSSHYSVRAHSAYVTRPELLGWKMPCNAKQRMSLRCKSLKTFSRTTRLSSHASEGKRAKVRPPLLRSETGTDKLQETSRVVGIDSNTYLCTVYLKCWKSKKPHHPAHSVVASA